MHWLWRIEMDNWFVFWFKTRQTLRFISPLTTDLMPNFLVSSHALTSSAVEDLLSEEAEEHNVKNEENTMD